MGTNHADYERRFALAAGAEVADMVNRQSVVGADGVCHEGAADVTVVISVMDEPVAGCSHTWADGRRIEV